MWARIAAAAPPLLPHWREQTEPTTRSDWSGEWGRKGEVASAAAGEETVRALHPDQARGVPARGIWEDLESQVISSTTRTDAAARLGELHDQILAVRVSFADLAVQHSARPPAAGLRQRAEHAMADSGLLGDG